MSRLGGSPTIQTLAAMVVVSGAYWVLSLVIGGFAGGLFVLGPTFVVRPWSLVTSVYAHQGPAHLIGNAVMLALVGLIVEQTTTRFRYHAFFITTGVVAGLSHVVLTGRGVLGASGAIFALLGYVVTGNTVSSSVLDHLRLSRRAQLVIFGVLAVIVTVITGSPGVALIAHFTGFLLGLLAGRVGLLNTRQPDEQTQTTSHPPGY